jgi:hypothetical protein
VTSTAMTRGIQGLSIEELKAKKSENPERRKAQREATVRYSCVCLFFLCVYLRAPAHAGPLRSARKCKEK